jgi:O-antigen/teichoic acid export membrane protein
VSTEANLSRQAAADVSTIARGAAAQALGQISARSILFFFTIAAANLLGVAGFGLYRKISQVLGVAGQLGLAGFQFAALRFISRARATQDHGGVRGAVRTALGGATFAAIVVSVVLLIGADVLAGYFSDSPEGASEFARLIRVGVLYVPAVALMQVLRYCTQAYKTMVPSVVTGDVVQPLVRAIVGVMVLLAGFGVAGAVTSLVFSMTVGAGVGAWYCLRMFTDAERAAPPRAEPAAMVRFALPQAGSSLLSIRALGLGVLMLGVLGTDRDVALFAVALALQGPGELALSGMIDIWAPVVSDLHSRGDLDRLDSLYKTITRWVATFSLPVYAALIIESDLFVKFFGSDYPDAAIIVAILAVGNIFHAVMGPAVFVLSMTGRPGINLVISSSAVLVYLVAGIAVVPEHGIAGMAVIDSVVTVLMNSVRVIVARSAVGIQPFGRSLLKPAAATAIGAAVLLTWTSLSGDDSIVLDSIGLVVATIVYLGALRTFGLDSEERYVWDLLQRTVRNHVAKSQR